MSYIDLTGQRFGRQIALEKVGTTSKGHALWKCECDCGKEVVVQSDHLCSGNTLSCGCYNKERAQTVHKKHGEHQCRLYNIWRHAKSRCRNPNDAAYKNYGGRGIQFTDDWNSYQVFKEWAMSHGYREDLTLDRIDVNGDYKPSNCRWATWKEQMNNTRRNKKYKEGAEKNIDQKHTNDI